MTNQVIPAQAMEAAHIPNAELHARGLRFCPGCQATRLHDRSVGAFVSPGALTAAVAAFSDAREAAHKAWREQPDAKGGSLEQNLRAALEAAAPYMLGVAWEEGEAAGQDNADSNRGYDIEHKYNPYRSAK